MFFLTEGGNYLLFKKWETEKKRETLWNQFKSKWIKTRYEVWFGMVYKIYLVLKTFLIYMEFDLERFPCKIMLIKPQSYFRLHLWCDWSSDRSFMVNPLSYFSFQPVPHDWCNKGCGMCYPVCRMMHIKEPLLLIEKSSLCGSSGFPLTLSEWSFTICPTPYNRK